MFLQCEITQRKKIEWGPTNLRHNFFQILVTYEPKFNHVVVFMKETHIKSLVKLGSKFEKFCALKLSARVYLQFFKNRNRSFLGRFPICISKCMKFLARSSVKNAIFISMNFEMMDRVLLKMSFFIELQAENFIVFDMHMRIVPKND